MDLVLFLLLIIAVVAVVGGVAFSPYAFVLLAVLFVVAVFAFGRGRYR